MDEMIERLQRRSANDAKAIPLGGGLPHSSMFPKEALSSAFARVVHADDAAALQYGWPEGRPRLRALIADRLATRGLDVCADDVIITSGAQQALAIATQLACRKGDRIGCASASYPAALELFRRSGLEPRDRLSRVTGAYVMPAIDNPRGETMNEARRQTLLSHAIPLFEDDAYADIYFGPKPPAPLVTRARDRVYYVGSFSKTLCPGLRVGYLIPPRRTIDAVRRLKQTLDLQANGLAQALVEHYLLANDFDAHLDTLRRTYAARAERLARALREALPELRFTFPRGGFSLWVQSDEALDQVALLERAVAHGTSFDPGRDFCVGNETSARAFRLTYSSLDEEDIEEGVRRLAAAIHAVRPARRMQRQRSLA